MAKLEIGINDLSTTHPQIAKEWDYEKNYPLTPQQVTHGINKKVWWLCPKGHSYDASINMRTLKHHNSSCPYCSGNKVLEGFNDLATTHPQLAKEWDYEKNYPLVPTQVSKGKREKVWWLCPKGHSYDTQISSRVSHNKGCPYCGGIRVLQGYNDLVTTHPLIAKRWDYERNNYRPEWVSKDGKRGPKIVWCILPCGASCSIRLSDMKVDGGCNTCANYYKCSFQSKIL